MIGSILFFFFFEAGGLIFRSIYMGLLYGAMKKPKEGWI
jgi:hypothetical protein